MKKPYVTVLMCVYNGKTYLREAISSILNQTFTDFEFLIIDDGSTDDSAAIIHSYTDPRIRYVSNGQNKGLHYSLNRGLELAEGIYIARMDCDDRSLPTRLETQVAFMDSHLDISVCGTWVETIGDKAGFVKKYFTNPEDIHASLLFNTSIAHPSVLMRKSVFSENNLTYDTGFKYFEEDYNLWVELARVGKLANIPNVLFFYRIHKKSVTHIHTEDRKSGVTLIRRKQLEWLGLTPNEEDMRIHNSLYPKDGESARVFLKNAETWFQVIQRANKTARIYTEDSLSKILYTRWYTLCGLNARHGFSIFKMFVRSPLYTENKTKGRLDFFKILVKSLMGSF